MTGGLLEKGGKFWLPRDQLNKMTAIMVVSTTRARMSMTSKTSIHFFRRRPNNDPTSRLNQDSPAV